MSKSLALFDFDNTLTNKDSFWAFLKFSKSRPKIVFAALSLFPKLAAYKLSLVKNDKAKIAVIRKLFSGQKVEHVKELGVQFSKSIIPQILNEKALKKLLWHKEQGHDVAVVSASIDWYLKPWCDVMKIDCICTKIKIEKDGSVGTEYEGENVYGEQKVDAIIRRYTLANYKEIFAYGDSQSGDGPMLKLANHAFYRRFD